MNNPNTKNPSWWTTKHSQGWDKVKDAIHRDWEQTKADFSKTKGQQINQGVGDTVKQAVGKEAIPPDHVANMHSDKLHKAYEDAEPALRYGYGASSQFTEHGTWDDKLEKKLSTDWDNLKTGRAWSAVKTHVKTGWERARKSS
jgi:hypothetical protein